MVSNKGQIKSMIVLLVGALILTSFLVVVLYKDINGNVVKTEENFKIGVILPLSGQAAYYGENVQDGVELALIDFHKKYW